jgi:hypothetical protein
VTAGRPEPFICILHLFCHSLSCPWCPSNFSCSCGCCALAPAPDIELCQSWLTAAVGCDGGAGRAAKKNQKRAAKRKELDPSITSWDGANSEATSEAGLGGFPALLVLPGCYRCMTGWYMTLAGCPLFVCGCFRLVAPAWPSGPGGGGWVRAALQAVQLLRPSQCEAQPPPD